VSPNIIGIVILVMLMAGIITGHPLAFVIGGVAAISAFFFWGHGTLFTFLTQAYWVMDNWLLMAVPMFVFMAMVLEKAGLIEHLYKAIYVWSGPLRGGLGVATIVACTIFAACTGVVAAGVVGMTLIALPQMLRYRYDKNMAIGPILAGGTLGQLIPPSVVIIVYGALTGTSIGKLFAGGLCSGLILSGLYIVYILVRSYLQKDLCPALPPEERVDLRQKFLLLRALVLPTLLIFGVLGSIFSGAATPTEASAVGAIGALICAAVVRKLNWRLIRDASIETMKLCGMIGWIFIGAACFTGAFFGTGGAKLVENTLLTVGFGSIWGSLAMVLIILLGLGMVIDVTVVTLVGAPLFLPVMVSLGFDPVWFGIIFVVMIQVGFISPPFGQSLFMAAGVAPQGVTMSDVYRSAWPFVALQLIGITIFILFPETVLWLPNLLFK
jgi:tripartite ATP-independent transporter DctM subunit